MAFTAEQRREHRAAQRVTPTGVTDTQQVTPREHMYENAIVNYDDDPIVGLSSITARYAVTRSGRLISTTLLSEEQMLAGGIWLGPDPADSDFKAEKVEKK